MQRVLLINENDVERTLLCQLLEQNGYTTLEAIDGTHALNLLCRDPEISFILTDLQIPNMGGLNFLKHVKTLYPHVPVVVLEVHLQRKWSAIILQKGSVSYLHKPLPLPELLSEVRDINSRPNSLLPI
jgi:CheY-like chemotaxis protein